MSYRLCRLLAKGKISHDDLVAEVSKWFPPEKCFRQCRRKNMESMSSEARIHAGRQDLAKRTVLNWHRYGLMLEADGFYFPSPRSRWNLPECFVAEIADPEMRSLAEWMAAKCNSDDEQHITGIGYGLRVALREMLKRAGLEIEWQPASRKTSKEIRGK